MNPRHVRLDRVPPAVLAVALISVQCADRGAGPPAPPGADVEECFACTPEAAMDHLQHAFGERDPDLYERLLDDGFLFTEADCLGEVRYHNGKQVELEVMGGRDSPRGIFDVFRTIEFGFWADDRREEPGADSPPAFEGDPDGHPEEDWLVFRGRVELLLLTKPDEGLFVDQVMTFKLRQEEDGMWRIRRWAGDPLVRECSESGEEPTVATESWGRIKASFTEATRG